jgi:hypothetical protein
MNVARHDHDVPFAGYGVFLQFGFSRTQRFSIGGLGGVAAGRKLELIGETGLTVDQHKRSGVAALRLSAEIRARRAHHRRRRQRALHRNRREPCPRHSTRGASNTADSSPRN